MVEGKVIEKDKKYMFQFPEGTPSDKQAEYLDKISDKLKNDQFVAIDPKIKVFDTKQYFQEQPPAPEQKPAETPAEKPAEEKPKEEAPVDETPKEKTEETTEETKPEEKPIEETKTSIDRVEIPAKEKEKPKTAFDEDGSSAVD